MELWRDILNSSTTTHRTMMGAQPFLVMRSAKLCLTADREVALAAMACVRLLTMEALVSGQSRGLPWVREGAKNSGRL